MSTQSSTIVQRVWNYCNPDIVCQIVLCQAISTSISIDLDLPEKSLDQGA